MISNLKSIEENQEYLKSVIGVDKRGYIDWKNSVGKEIEYEYDGIDGYSKGVLKIREYNPKSQKMYFEGYEKGIYSDGLIKCKLGRILNIIYYKAQWMIGLGMSIEDAKKYTIGNHEKIEVKCPDCGKIKKIAPKTIYKTHSIQCSCGDGISYPEKFLENVLIQLNVKYERQYKTDWSQNRRYDFYLLDANTIIEVHGGQHYRDTARGRSLKEEQENDKLKEELAFKNGINNYIVIDCRESTLNWIKNNILNSKLNELFDLNRVDWNKCLEYSLKNKVKEICDYKKEHTELSVADLAKEFGMNKSTITKYLKQGTELGWCKYDAKEEKRRSSILNGKCRGKLVSQFTLEGKFIKTYPSAYEAEKQTGINYQCIGNCCRGKQKTAGGYVWKFKE